jgi:hypothetical protein
MLRRSKMFASFLRFSACKLYRDYRRLNAFDTAVYKNKPGKDKVIPYCLFHIHRFKYRRSDTIGDPPLFLGYPERHPVLLDNRPVFWKWL